MYDKLPNKLKVTATQYLIHRMLTDNQLSSIAQLQRMCEERMGNDPFCQQEKNSGYLYKKRNGSAIEWKDKLVRLEKVYPDFRTILDHRFFQLLADGRGVFQSLKWHELGQVFGLFDFLDKSTSDPEFPKHLGIKRNRLSSFNVFEQLMSYRNEDALNVLSEALIARFFLHTEQVKLINNYVIHCAWATFLNSLGKPKYPKYLNQQLLSCLRSIDNKFHTS